MQRLSCIIFGSTALKDNSKALDAFLNAGTINPPGKHQRIRESRVGDSYTWALASKRNIDERPPLSAKRKRWKSHRCAPKGRNECAYI